MIIDIHNHLAVTSSPYHLPVGEYLKAMDENGVEKAVILGKDYGKMGDAQGSNLPDEETADFVKSHPDRFIGFTAVHPDRGINANLRRVERAVQDLGLRGIKINPHSGYYPNDERLYPVYERATEHGIPVVFHTGVKAPADGTRMKYCHPVYLDDVAVDFPDLTIIMAHAGYPWVEEAILVGLYAGNVYADISTLPQIEAALGYEVMMPTLRKLITAWGAQRVLFGSDGIFNFEETIKAVNRADFISEGDRRKIFRESAKRVLQLS
jgi:hypothetical protein